MRVISVPTLVLFCVTLCLSQTPIPFNSFYFLSVDVPPFVSSTEEYQYYGRFDPASQETIYFAQQSSDPVNGTLSTFASVFSVTYKSFFSIVLDNRQEYYNVSIHAIPVNQSLISNNNFCFINQTEMKALLSMSSNDTIAIVVHSYGTNVHFHAVQLSQAINAHKGAICQAQTLAIIETELELSEENIVGGAWYTNGTETHYFLATSNSLYDFDLTNGTYTAWNISSVSISPIINVTSGLIYLLSQVNSSYYVINQFDITTGLVTAVVSNVSAGKLLVDQINEVFFVTYGQSIFIYTFDGILMPAFKICESWAAVIYIEGAEPAYCPNNCQNAAQGRCVNDVCQCDSGWDMSDCSGCDSTAFCNAHGVCLINELSTSTCYKPFYGTNRSCDCVGWYGDRCQFCDSKVICSGHGNCSGFGSCSCDIGFSGANCSACSSQILCNSNGYCRPDGSCACYEYWGEYDCSLFILPNHELVISMKGLNWAAASVLWLFLLVCLYYVIYLSDSPKADAAGNYISLSANQAALVYFQSFSLLMTTNESVGILCDEFRLFQLFNLEVEKSMWRYQQKFWTESSMFLIKLGIFAVWLIALRVAPSAKLKGILIQFGFWCHFTLVSSLFLRLRIHQCTENCPSSYNIVAVILAVILLITLIFLYYRLWKAISSNRMNLDVGNFDSYAYKRGREIKSGPLRVCFGFFSVIFYPWSEILSSIFTRFRGSSEPQPSGRTGSVMPPPAINADGFKSIPGDNRSVEEFIMSIMRKTHMDIDREIDGQKIVAMLKGNWYTTVADLRTISEDDAEKLRIPLRLYNAMRDELPREEKTEAYTALDSLVKSSERDDFEKKYRCAVDLYQSVFLFKLDVLTMRNLMWILLAVALTNYELSQLLTLAILEGWYIAYLLWHRPQKSHGALIGELFAEIGMFVVILTLLSILYFQDRYYLISWISVINLVVALGSLLSPACYTFYGDYRAKREDENYRKTQIKESVNTGEKTPLLREILRTSAPGPSAARTSTSRSSSRPPSMSADT
eukprot:TRINITY_DN10732_c0_g2_i1.p1 TRINITY_DN10732_c0_g2~~TRINITY_DN10732_c0_g2_i1.p1  ORF type:complete len:1023 (-),score=202.04 TRINITY_DN10732_c0_g2_i1:285-3353(-)